MSRGSQSVSSGTNVMSASALITLVPDLVLFLPRLLGYKG